MTMTKHDARRFRHPADRRPSPRQFARRDPALGADAGRGRVPVLPRRPPRADGRRRSGRAARQRPRNGRGADRQRDRSRASRSCSRQSAVPAHAELRLDPQRHRAHGLAQPDDAVEGQGRARTAKARRVGLFTYPVLQAADILLYQRDPRAGRRGPEAACRADPRHRAQVQHRLRRRPVRRARAVHRRRHRGAGHEPARRTVRKCRSPIRRT